MAVKDYNTNPDLNTTISGINIAEGCPPSGINNAIRQLMADVKQNADEQDSNVMTGATASAAGSAGLVPAPAAGKQNKPLRGDGTWADSLNCDITGNAATASMANSLSDISGEPVNLQAIVNLIAKYLPLVGGTMTGGVTFANGYAIKRNVDNEALIISGGTEFGSTDTQLILYGKSHPTASGVAEFRIGGASVYIGLNGIFYPNGTRVVFNDDIDFQIALPNETKFLPAGGTWKVIRIQSTPDRIIAEMATFTSAGGSQLNTPNLNTQLLISVRIAA